MPTDLPPVTVKKRIHRALTKIAQYPLYQKVANTLNGISASPNNTRALATINEAPLSQRALNIKQVHPHVLLASSTQPDEPAWAAPSQGQAPDKIDSPRKEVKKTISRAVKHFPKPSRGKKILKAATAVISFGLAGAGGLLIYAAIPFLPYAAAGWLAVGGACLLTAAGIGIYSLISYVARNNTKKSIADLHGDAVKRQIMAEELLAFDKDKRNACITLLPETEQPKINYIMESIQAAPEIVESFDKGSRNPSALSSLKNIRYPERLSANGDRVTEVKEHLECFAQSAKIVSRRESYAASEQGLAQARVDREFLVNFRDKLDTSLDAEMRLLHAIDSRLIQLDQIISELETQHERPVLLDKPKGSG